MTLVIYQFSQQQVFQHLFLVDGHQLHRQHEYQLLRLEFSLPSIQQNHGRYLQLIYQLVDHLTLPQMFPLLSQDKHQQIPQLSYAGTYGPNLSLCCQLLRQVTCPRKVYLNYLLKHRLKLRRSYQARPLSISHAYYRHKSQ